MPAGANAGGLSRRRRLARLAGVGLATFLLATVAHAAITPIEPSEGVVEPGESVTGSFTVVDSVTSCFTAGTPSGLSARFNGLGLGLLPAGCAVEGAEVKLRVTASSAVSPGDYTVTITETAIGGALLATHEWPIVVVDTSAVTTTTIATTTTTIPPSTTTTSSGTASTSSPTTTSTSSTNTSKPSTNTSTPSSDDSNQGTTSTTTVSGVAADTTSPSGFSDNSEEAPDTTSTDTTPATDTTIEDDPEVLAASSDQEDPPYQRYAGQLGEEEPRLLSRTALSDRLRSEITGAMPWLVPDAVLSPMVIAEYLLRSLWDSSKGLLIPTAIVALIGLTMVWRMRREVVGDELALPGQSMD